MPSGQLLVRHSTSNVSLMWYWSWFIPGSISPHRNFTFILFQIVVDGQLVISVQGMAVLFPIYRTHHIYWKVWVGLLFHHILPNLPSALNFVPALEGGDMDKDHVSHLQGHCLAASVIILFVAFHFLLLKKVSLPVSPLYVVSQRLDIFAGSGFGYQFWGYSKGDINGK